MKHLYKRVDSKIATVGVVFAAGARYESGEHPHGIAHMLEHMFFKGTKTRMANELMKEIGFLGGQSNAFTSDEEVMYHISVPYENLEKAVEILSDMILNPAFPEEEFLREKEVVKEEALQYMQSENWRRHYFLSEQLSKGRMKYPLVGTSEDIASFTIEHIWNYYREFCTRERMIVGMSSNLEDDKAKKIMAKYFGNPDDIVSFEHITWDNQGVGPNRLEFNWPTLEQVEFEMSWRSIKIREFQHTPTSRMLFTILGSGMDSRLWENVREKHGLCYGIHAYAQAYIDSGSAIISASTREDNIPLLRELIEAEITKLKTELVSEEEMERARNKYRMSTYAKNEGSQATLRSILHREFYDLPSMEEFDEQIFQVTPADIREFARNVFVDENLIIIESKKGPQTTS